MKHLTVTVAILIHNGEILCMQRKKSHFSYVSLKYEFPGGKVENEESFEAALTRKLKEELNLDLAVEPRQHFMTVDHTYTDFQITIHCYRCEISHRTIEYNDHESYI
ncbi:NUDIX domain-containing protein [Acidaminobacter sp.]|uniref:NUDIX domain-containing protein n=1 Tax=Acidaminobacter sp. TaxID=1872102 RepID=UPI002562D5CD|nr:NUDIX domain-containing protein [Acidaminobacter sp.]MDK9711144.1 NUDIX domain-containing protein [Acidaminobacter sp.]